MKNIFLLPANSHAQTLGIGLELGINNSVFLDGIMQNIYITSDEEIKDDDYAIYLFGKIVQKVKMGINASNLKAHKKIILTTDQDLIKDGVQAIDDNFLEWFVRNPSCEKVEVNKLLNSDVFIGGSLYCYQIIIPKEELEQKVIEEHYLSTPIPLTDVSRMKLDNHSDLHKQETLEEATERKYPLTNILHLQLNTAIRTGFQEGAKWQQEQSNKEIAMWKLAVEKQEARCKALKNTISNLQEIIHSEEEVIQFASFAGKNYIKAKGFYYMKGDFEKKHKVSIHEIFEQFKKK